MISNISQFDLSIYFYLENPVYISILAYKLKYKFNHLARHIFLDSSVITRAIVDFKYTQIFILLYK